MNMSILKQLFLLCLAMFYAISPAKAQRGIEDGSIFGHGKDSIDCLLNIGMTRELVKKNDFKKAYLPWKMAFSSCPKAQISLYNDGAKILHEMLKTEQDSLKRIGYLNELSDLYNKNILYKKELSRFLTNPIREDLLLAVKAYDYLHYAGNALDIKQAYKYCKDAVCKMDKNDPAFYLMCDWMVIDSIMYKNDSGFKNEFINDFITAAYISENARKKAQTSTQSLWENTLSRIYQIAKDCGLDSYESIADWYKRTNEQQQQDYEILKETIAIMKKFHYEKQPLFSELIEKAAASNDPELLNECAWSHYRNGEKEKCTTLLEKVFAQNNSMIEKSNLAYETAKIFYQEKDLPLAKKYAQLAIEQNEHNGEAYILLARIYASQPDWSENPILNKCTYFLIIDKLQQAKRMDLRTENEANELIRKYVTDTPQTNDLLFMNIKQGDQINIGGWINENIIIQ